MKGERCSASERVGTAEYKWKRQHMFADDTTLVADSELCRLVGEFRRIYNED